MKRFGLFLLLFFPASLAAQNNILDKPHLLEKVNHCLESIYAYHFEEATVSHLEIESALPNHPATSFLKALLIYWENMPLTPENPESIQFLRQMERTVALADSMLEQNADHLEGIFFDLHARAFMAMFWADNGRPGKVLSDIDNMYRQMLRGFERMDEFNEFYFSSGLYNYYIEAYPETHPVYKPLALLLRKGDKEKGLQHLRHATLSTTYLRVEAIFFMSLIQLNYENNMTLAARYAANLYNRFPDNIFYTGHYITILLHNDRIEFAEILLENLDRSNDPYARMLYQVLGGMVQEIAYRDYDKARRMYNRGLELSEPFSPFANLHRAMAYAGRSRIAKLKGTGNAKQLSRQAERLTNYRFILDYVPPGSR